MVLTEALSNVPFTNMQSDNKDIMSIDHSSFSFIDDALHQDDDPFNAALDKVLGFEQTTQEEADIFDDMFAHQDPFHGFPLVSEDDNSERSKITETSSVSDNTLQSDDTNSFDEQSQAGSDLDKKNDVPKKPKRSLSAYNLFFQAERQNLLKNIPDRDPGAKPRRSHGKLGFADMAKTIAANWKKISPDEKVKFEQLSAQDIQRYNREMAEWKELTGGIEIPSPKKKRKNAKAKKEKSNKKAKTAPTPLPKSDSTLVVPVTVSTSVISNSLETPQEILVQSKTIEEEPTTEPMVSFTVASTPVVTLSAPMSMVNTDMVDKKTDKKTNKKKKERKNKKQPRTTPRRSLSAYNLFFQAERKKLLENLPAAENKPKKSHGKLGFADMAKTIAKAWKEITAEDKMHFEYLSALDADRYEREMAAYKKSQYEKDLAAYKESQKSTAAVVKTEARNVEPSPAPLASAFVTFPQPQVSISSFLRKNLCRV